MFAIVYEVIMVPWLLLGILVLELSDCTILQCKIFWDFVGSFAKNKEIKIQVKRNWMEFWLQLGGWVMRSYTEDAKEKPPRVLQTASDLGFLNYLDALLHESDAQERKNASPICTGSAVNNTQKK